MTSQDTNFTFSFSGKTLHLKQPLVMGVLNLTSDSFFDGNNYNTEAKIITQVEKMISEGAAIIDVGAQSSRPGAKIQAEKDELERLIPALKIIVKNFPSIVISVDTFRGTIAQQVVDCGAAIINDISGGTMDAKMFSTIAHLKVPYVLMHIQGTPITMQLNPTYQNVVEEVSLFFKKQIETLNDLGVKQLILDPGFGFGKTLEHNFGLLKNFSTFKTYGYPLLAGLSRKSMINKVINTKPEEALNGTSVLNTIALLNGAAILRVHDVKQAVETIKLTQAYLK